MGVAPVHPVDSQTSSGKGVMCMKKRILIRAGLGFLFGIALGILIAVCMSIVSGDRIQLYSDILLARVGNPMTALLLQFLFSGLYGAICMGGMLVYQIEHWPLLRASTVHFFMTMLPFPPIALLLGWCGGKDLAVIIGIMTVVYFMIWLVMYLIYRAQVRELNQINQKQNGAEGDDDTPSPQP